MVACYKCGGPIEFKKLPSGNWLPTNPDGSSHWDDCSKARCLGTYGIKRQGPTSLPPILTKGIATVFYDGGEPPWEISEIKDGQFQFLSIEDDIKYKTEYPNPFIEILGPLA